MYNIYTSLFLLDVSVVWDHNVWHLFYNTFSGSGCSSNIS